jgi:hypothetical protein
LGVKSGNAKRALSKIVFSFGSVAEMEYAAT